MTAGTPQPRVYEAVIKVVTRDPPERRARDIAEGISYACALLMDEYGWTADAIECLLEDCTNAVQDEAARRADSS